MAMGKEPLDLEEIKKRRESFESDDDECRSGFIRLSEEERDSLVAEIERLRAEPAKRQIEMAGSMYEHVSRLEKELQAERVHADRLAKTLEVLSDEVNDSLAGKPAYLETLSAEKALASHRATTSGPSRRCLMTCNPPTTRESAAISPAVQRVVNQSRPFTLPPEGSHEAENCGGTQESCTCPCESCRGSYR